MYKDLTWFTVSDSPVARQSLDRVIIIVFKKSIWFHIIIQWSHKALEHLENVKLKMQCINCKNKHLICLTYFTVNSVIQDLIQSPGNCKLKLLWSAIWYVCTRSGMYTYSGIWELKKCNRTYHHTMVFLFEIVQKLKWGTLSLKVADQILVISNLLFLLPYFLI